MTSSYSSHSLPNQQQCWYTYSPSKTLTLLDTNLTTGLQTEVVSQRQQHYGPNEIKETAGRSNWQILLEQFNNLMLIVLIGVAIISGILDLMDLRAGQVSAGGVPFSDTIAIFSIVILNTVLSYLQETRAEKAVAALKRTSSPQVIVIRNGEQLTIDAASLVPGDVILIESGDNVCADGQILAASNLQIRESALTGEADPVTKNYHTEGLAEDTPIGDRTNMVFTGTEVIQGWGKVVVTNTGMATELGKIGLMLQSVEDEPTPLQQRMTHLGNVLVTGSLILVALVVVGGTLKAANFSALKDLVEVSLSMTVAIIPEGLPSVITVTLALGTQRMVKRHALIRKLSAVETVGAVNVICSDKTGTLTQNKMVVQEIATLVEEYRVTGDDYTPEGEFLNSQQQSINVSDYPCLYTLLLCCVLCNDAHLGFHEEDWKIIGDPTEGALLALAGKAGLQKSTLEVQFPRLREFPFSSERKRMSVICELSDLLEKDQDPEASYLMWTKGSAEVILERCQFYQVRDQVFLLNSELRTKILRSNEEIAEKGYRVLGFAYKPLPFEIFPVGKTADLVTAENNEQDLIWLGLVGMMDAPRPEVCTSVAQCYAAGIRPIMITGDHLLTAQAIAQQLGILREGDRILTGLQLERLSQRDLDKEASQVSVYASVSPEHKLRIVKALQKEGNFVAMTGNGVDDAPALKQADIGISMGIIGTDVSKEASDMILLDDNFATIVVAAQEGRLIYNNIRHFIKYILACNMGEMMTIAAAPILGLSGVPLTPLQILWMNLVTDGLPALALAVEPKAPDVMKHPPFSPKESIFARGVGNYIVRIGIVFSIISISLMLWTFYSAKGAPDSWKTMVFTTLCIAQVIHAIAARSTTSLAIEMNQFSNPYLLGAVIVTILLQLMIVYVPPLRTLFDTEALTIKQLIICLLFSSLLFTWIELEKLFIRCFKRYFVRT